MLLQSYLAQTDKGTNTQLSKPAKSNTAIRDYDKKCSSLGVGKEKKWTRGKTHEQCDLGIQVPVTKRIQENLPPSK